RAARGADCMSTASQTISATNGNAPVAPLAVTTTRLAPYTGNGWSSGDSSLTAPTQPPFQLTSLWRFKWTMFIVFLFACGLLLPLALMSYVPSYQATAVIEVAPVVPYLLYKTDENGPIPFYQQYLTSQVAVITGSRVLNRALDNDKVKNLQWYSQKYA